jgi:hypothetical protein
MSLPTLSSEVAGDGESEKAVGESVTLASVDGSWIDISATFTSTT